MCPWILDDQAGGFGMLIGMLLWGLIGLALLVLIIITIARLLSARTFEFFSTQVDRRADARALLDERYARGEIDDEEYQRRIRLLSLR
ncbi:MAG: SHOCT domain-containing protein [Cyanobacteria bacterium NC_groundwater_1444_Ag_S-0.65um_54_12]|nr:SHOCT domain-containing protein [Cyanobacteria bacterium NC_groundwater_1444_Ag_S-0.65um_54_12]